MRKDNENQKKKEKPKREQRTARKHGNIEGEKMSRGRDNEMVKKAESAKKMCREEDVEERKGLCVCRDC